MNSRPELHATPTWAGQGAPLGWAGGFDDPGGGGWRYAAKRSLYCRATTIDTALPRVEPMAIGRSLRLVSSSDGSSPSFERAIRRPTMNQGRTDAGMCPSKMVVARLKRASAPRPGMTEEGAPGGGVRACGGEEAVSRGEVFVSPAAVVSGREFGEFAEPDFMEMGS